MFSGRLSYNEFGSTLNANSETIWTYTQALYYNGFSEMYHRSTTTWNVPAEFGRTMTNGRLDAYGSETLDYDAAGNLLRQEPNSENWQASVFDAAGRKTGYEEKWRRGGPISGQPLVKYHGESTVTHDGEGRIVKEDWEKDYIYNGNPTSGWDTTSRSIYSTVLGGEIASIEENFYGVMEKTRVYAGGAVIGEQQRWTATGQSTGETYSHIFRDPVSGSVIRGGLEEHYEPLGQKIDPVPPLEDPTFPGPNDGFNDARFPEWQCMAAEARGLEDSELPQHCQRAAEQRNIWAKIEATWSAWPDEDGNALKLADSPLFNGASGNHSSLSFATRTMSASLTTTAKKLDGDGDCDWDKDGNPDCAVTVTAMPDIPDFKDAGFSEENTLVKDTACSRMTRVLDGVVNLVIKNFGGRQELLKTNHSEIDTVVSDIDKIISNIYVGRALNSLSAAYDLSSFGKGPSIAEAPYGGQSGFKPQFRQGNDLANDQTHHAITYFSGGINGMAISTSVHSLIDDNKADQLLGKEAYDKGYELRKRGSIVMVPMPFFPYIRPMNVNENPRDRALRVIGVAGRLKREVCE